MTILKMLFFKKIPQKGNILFYKAYLKRSSLNYCWSVWEYLTHLC